MKQVSALYFFLAFALSTRAYVTNPFTNTYSTESKAVSLSLSDSLPNYTSTNSIRPKTVVNSTSTTMTTSAAIPAPVPAPAPVVTSHTHSYPSMTMPAPMPAPMTMPAPMPVPAPMPAPVLSPMPVPTPMPAPVPSPLPVAAVPPHTHAYPSTSYTPYVPQVPKPTVVPSVQTNLNPYSSIQSSSQSLTYEQIIQYLMNSNGSNLAGAVNGTTAGNGTFLNQCKVYCDSLPPSPVCDSDNVLYRNECEAKCVQKTVSTTTLRYGMCCCSDADFNYDVVQNVFISSVPKTNFCVSKCIFNCLGGEAPIIAEHTADVNPLQVGLSGDCLLYTSPSPRDS